MTQWQSLEKALRTHGFLAGRLTASDEAAIDALLKDLRKIFADEELA